MEEFIRRHHPENLLYKECSSTNVDRTREVFRMSDQSQCNPEDSSCDQCKLLEDRIKRQNEDLHRRSRIHEEMRALIDWLKRDVGRAQARIRELETGEVMGTNGSVGPQLEKKDSDNQETLIQPPVSQEQLIHSKLESLRIKLTEGSEKLSKLEEKVYECETKIERLQRTHQAYYEEVRELKSKVQQQAKDLRINKEIEAEREEKIKNLVIDNEHLSYMICRQKIYRGQLGIKNYLGKFQ